MSSKVVKFFVASKIKPVTLGRAMMMAADRVSNTIARVKSGKSFRANLSNRHTSVNVAVFESSAEMSSHRSFHDFLFGIATDRPSSSSLYSRVSSDSSACCCCSWFTFFDSFPFGAWVLECGGCSIKLWGVVEKQRWSGRRRKSWSVGT